MLRTQNPKEFEKIAKIIIDARIVKAEMTPGGDVVLHLDNGFVLGIYGVSPYEGAGTEVILEMEGEEE